MGVILSLPWKVHFFTTQRGSNIIREWLEAEKISKEQRADFQQKIDALERGGPELMPGFIFGPIAKDIYKAKIKGNKGRVQLRPMLCRGPFGDFEYTFLLGAIERDGELHPSDCRTRAQDNLKTLKADRSRRTRERIA